MKLVVINTMLSRSSFSQKNICASIGIRTNHENTTVACYADKLQQMQSNFELIYDVLH